MSQIDKKQDQTQQCPQDGSGSKDQTFIIVHNHHIIIGDVKEPGRLFPNAYLFKRTNKNLTVPNLRSQMKRRYLSQTSFSFSQNFATQIMKLIGHSAER